MLTLLCTYQPIYITGLCFFLANSAPNNILGNVRVGMRSRHWHVKYNVAQENVHEN